MTRKDYELLAKAGRDIMRFVNTQTPNPLMKLGAQHAIKTLAIYLESDNPHFDKARFLKDCGVDVDMYEKLPKDIEQLTCSSCGKSDDTVRERECGFTREIHDEIRLEVICDDCEDEHLGDI